MACHADALLNLLYLNYYTRQVSFSWYFCEIILSDKTIVTIQNSHNFAKLINLFLQVIYLYEYKCVMYHVIDINSDHKTFILFLMFQMNFVGWFLIKLHK